MNRLIKHVTVIGLFVLAVSIGVNAQSGQQYRAEVPFDFEAGGKQYAAGEYAVGPLSASGGIAIRNVDKGGMRLLGLTASDGTKDWNKPGTLTFHKVNGRYRLSEIATATFSMKIKSRRADRELASKDSPVPEIVAVKLNK